MSEENSDRSDEHHPPQKTKSALELKTLAQTAFMEGDFKSAQEAAVQWSEVSDSGEAELFLKRLESYRPKKGAQSKKMMPNWGWAVLAGAVLIGGIFGAVQFLGLELVEPAAVVREPEIVAKPEIQAEPTDQPTPRPTAKPTTKPPALPVANPTAGPTDVPTAEPTPEPTMEPTEDPSIRFAEENQPAEGVKLVAGPITAEITHDTSNSAQDPASRDFALSEIYVIAEDQQNFVITTDLINPYSISEFNWDAGFEFRDINPGNLEPTSDDTGFYQFRMSASNNGVYQFRYWSYLFNTWAYLDSGLIPPGLLNQAENSTNNLKLVVDRGKWEFYLNDEFVAESNQEMVRLREPGQIRVAIGMDPKSEVDGKKTTFENTAVWSLR